MTNEAVRKDTISARLATLAGAIGALETAIEATDKALRATSVEDLRSAISSQTQAAERTLLLKQKLQQSLPNPPQDASRQAIRDLLKNHPQSEQLLPQVESIEQRLREGQISLSQQALVVNKMQAINRQLLGVLTQADNQGYDHQGAHDELGDGRMIAKV